jgi:hypothetical protein
LLVSLNQVRCHVSSFVVRLSSLGLLAVAAVAGPAAAQQTQLDAHGNFVTTTSSHTQSWGAGVAVQMTFGSSTAPAQLSVAPGFDYLKQENSGPSQETVALDVDVQPGGSSTITPYVGVSASENWSSGTSKQWSGGKLGLETLGGVQIKAGTNAAVKAEERFGYVNGQEHTLTTRVGVLLKI